MAAPSLEKDYFFRFDTTSPNFFTQSEKSMLLSYILELESYDWEDNDDSDTNKAGNRKSQIVKCPGLKTLISQNVFTAGYPLHDVSKDLQCSAGINNLNISV